MRYLSYLIKKYWLTWLNMLMVITIIISGLFVMPNLSDKKLQVLPLIIQECLFVLVITIVLVVVLDWFRFGRKHKRRDKTESSIENISDHE